MSPAPAHGPVLVPPDGHHRGLLVWDLDGPRQAISSASVGGGLRRVRWVLAVGVDKGYTRTDLTAHVAEIVAGLGLGLGGEEEVCALFTAADVAQVAAAGSGGVRAWATVGVTRPTWPVRTGGAGARASSPPPPGTVNLVVSLPVALSPSALVQAVGTATEAKTQVLVQAGVPGTGTASDALVVLCPIVDAGDRGPAPDGPVEFAGVRSPWGAHLARAVHGAVAAGLAAHPWPPDDVDPAVVW